MSGNGQGSATAGHCLLAASGEQRKKAFLRLVGLQGLPADGGVQVVGQHLGLTHGINAGLGQAVGEGGAIAGGKHAAVAAALQGLVYPHKALVVTVQVAVSDHPGATYAGAPEHPGGVQGSFVGVERIAAFFHPCMLTQLDAVVIQIALHAPPHGFRVAWQ